MAASELETLALLTAETAEITIADIRAACPQAKGSIYDLTESLKTRHYASCFKAMAQLRVAGEDPIKLMGLIMFNIRFFLQLCMLKGTPVESIAKQLGKHPFFIKQVMGPVLKHYTQPTLELIFDKFATMDYNIKSGKISSDVLFNVGPALLCLTQGK